MNKRYLHYVLKQLRKLRYAYLIAALLISGFVFVMAFRQNNLTAINLRDAVLQADKDNGDVEAALKALREHTYTHMNANLAGGAGSVYPPIQLKYRYERLVVAEKSRVDTSNAALQAEAQRYCQPRSSARIEPLASCVQNYVSARGLAQAQAVPDAMYKFDFVSPIWSPDRAGWSLLVTVVLFLGLLVRGGLELWLRRSLRE